MARRRKKKQSIFNKKTFLGAFIVGIMVLSGLGYMMGDSESPTSYKGHKFSQQGDLWVTEIDNKLFGFLNHPDDIDHINVSDEAMNRLKTAKFVYIVFDPDSEIVSSIEVARMQMEKELFDLGIFPVSAITMNSSLYDLPLITCANATEMIPVLYFIQDEASGVSFENNCVIASAIDDYDIPILKERLMYGIYGII